MGKTAREGDVLHGYKVRVLVLLVSLDDLRFPQIHSSFR